MKYLCLLVVLAACLSLSYAAHGVDVSSPVSKSDFDCIKKAGFDYVVVRCYQSNGQLDPNCPDTMKAANDAGLNPVDAYIFPCRSCGDGGKQVNDTVDYLHKNNIKFEKIWFDIEGPGIYWGSDHSSNSAFFGDMVHAAKQKGVSIGVYTSESQWPGIMGGYTGGSDYPLWYANYDGIQSFSDFAPFNGWKTPYAKQYEGTTYICNSGVDKDWHP